MKKNQETLLSALVVLGIIGWVFFAMKPQFVSKTDESLSDFSAKRALLHVAKMAEQPHAAGTINHDAVADYVEKELKNLGLETSIQQGTTLTEWGNLVQSKNILARIDGTANSKALLLLSHYDSAPHSASKGASDDASGVATILEGVRAFLQNKTPHKNDIIILFTDAEELGLNGAALFVTKNGWAKDVGVALNFEARGTSGPAYMFMEVNQGNAKMVEAFSEAKVKYPVSNSLMYSIYKMLPNDTDLTVLREQRKIPGFNFAFIDGHFNYHTAQDDIDHIDHTSVAHEGTYLMPLLGYLSNADLAALSTADDHVYFNTPFNFISYPFDWIYPMLIVSAIFFLFFVFIGIGKRALLIPEIGKGFLYLFAGLLLAGLVGFFGWKLILVIYPQYSEILQGFTYNGHSYMLSFIFITLGIAFLVYKKRVAENIMMSHFIAPLFLWILINLGIAVWLPGAAFFIIPVFCSLLMLAWYVLAQRTNSIFNLILSMPALMLLVPFIWMFPIGLGLKIMFGSAILLLLVFGLLLPIFGTFNKKGLWAFFMFLAAVGFFADAHLNSDFESGRARPNSLVYIYDADTDKASWASYDSDPDEWTKNYLGNNPKEATISLPLFSKYGTKFTFSENAPVKNLVKPTIEFLMDSVIGNQRYLKIRITSNRKVSRYDISASERTTFYNMKANGVTHINQNGSVYKRFGPRLLSYYLAGNAPLELQFSINKNAPLDMLLLESSFDLLSNPLFNMAQRNKPMMPKPFVLNDAVILMQKVRPTPRAEKPVIPVLITAPPTETFPAGIMDTIADTAAKN